MTPGLILQHAETGPPGRLGAWARERGVAFEVLRSWESSPGAVDISAYGWVASLGSAHSANDTQPGWIPAEEQLLHRAVQAGVPVLGLCWGGQALARVLGATVSAAAVHEKGWLTIDSNDPQIPAGPWLHYHTEIFTIPAGAVQLAHSPAGPAAFRHGPHLGLQFHPEADAAMAKVWADKDPDQTAASRAELAAAGARWSESAGTLAWALFDGWWAEAVSGQASAFAAGDPTS